MGGHSRRNAPRLLYTDKGLAKRVCFHFPGPYILVLGNMTRTPIFKHILGLGTIRDA